MFSRPPTCQEIAPGKRKKFSEARLFKSGASVRGSVGLFLGVVGADVAFVTAGRHVVFVELPSAIGTVEFMAFAGHSGKGNRHQQQGE